MRYSRLLLLAAAALAACDSPSGGEDGPTSLHSTIVTGDAQEDSVRAVLADSLVVRLTDERGRPVPNLTVGWSVLTQGGGEALPASSLTDADGRARTTWRLGTKAGAHEIEVRSTLNGKPVILDTLRATARPGAAVTAAIAGDSIRAIGPLEATGVLLSGADQHGNPIPAGQVRATWSSSAGAVAGVSDEGNIVAAAPGRATITAAGNGWTLRVHLTVTGMRATLWPTRGLVTGIHGDGARLLGAGDEVTVRGSAGWAPEPGLTPMVYVPDVHVLPSGEAWAVGAEPTQRVVWRSTAPGVWTRATSPAGVRAEYVTSAQGAVFIASGGRDVYRRDGDGWMGLGNFPIQGELNLSSLSAAAPDEVWAGGSVQPSFGVETSQPVLMRWSNFQWTEVAMPAGVTLQQRNAVRVAAPRNGGPVHALLWTGGATATWHLLRVAGGTASVVPLPAGVVAIQVVYLGVGPDGTPCITADTRIACQRNGAWREHVLADGWFIRDAPFIDQAGRVYVSVSRRVDGTDQYAVAELEVF